jgi:hypothetical protein
MRTNLDMMRTDVTFILTIKDRLYLMPKYEPLILRKLKIILEEYYLFGMNYFEVVN